MNPFEFRRAASLAEAADLLSASKDGEIIAGGIDLLSEMKEGTRTPSRLVSLDNLPELSEITETLDGITIGAMTTITAIEQHPGIGQRYCAIAEAAERLATPQIRNVGTLAGNLCQRPRCWYYRNPHTLCLKQGGEICYALGGHSKYMCVTGGSCCYMVHPSDTAVALIAFGASIAITGPTGARTMALEDFFSGPEVDATKENVLDRGDVVQSIHIPAPPPGAKSIFLKAQERVAGGFALSSAAVVVTTNGATVERASVILGGVAPTPLRAREVEAYLIGREVDQVNPREAGALALPHPDPFEDNRYKVILARNLVARALSRTLQLGY